MNRQSSFGAVLALTLLAAGSVRAQQIEPENPAPWIPPEPGTPMAQSAPGSAPPLPQAIRGQRPDWRPASGGGMAVMLGGGIGDFRNNGELNRTDVGGSWNLRLVAGTRLPVGIEAAYVGGMNDIDGPGVGADDYLMRNGLEGAFRFNLPLAPEALLSPFATLGIAWNRLSIMNAGEDVQVRTPDDQLLVPVGAGLATGSRGFIADARFTYRQAFNEQLFGPADMSHWNVSVNVGAEF